MKIFHLSVLLSMAVVRTMGMCADTPCCASCYYGGPGNPNNCQASNCGKYVCNDMQPCGGQNDICDPDMRPGMQGYAYCH
ncbi:unnamed protein product [Zymoseptoria tritici ST99CH_1A5]|uniref:Chitin-binding type-1 domain-containing protein n=2 Tax=Zymoseptoria tritici TaxID=1047171 RepID=A0A1X7RVH4_ZYMT9|nr:unnamed protein product [Zymoseptoria tritici ST99CH_3D7]SMY24836.1 unnamed protein product [Zymoseptoria tritici ST99CH_1A5]